MYVRDVKNREEVWLLDQIEALELDDAAFRSRDYVVAIDETTGRKAGFGRIRIHKVEGETYCELTSLGVLPEWRGQGVGAHVVERLIEYARDDGFERVYAFVDEPGYLTQFGFEPIETSALPQRLVERAETVRENRPDAVALALDLEDFEFPERLRERFKTALPDDEQRDDDEPTETAEDFGIDPDEATYKYEL